MKKPFNAQMILKNDFEYITSEIENFISELEQQNSIEYEKNSFLHDNIDKSLVKILKSALLSKAKRIRPLFCFWIFRNFFKSQKILKTPLKSVTKIALSIEILHNASLIIDDIEDASQTRRESPALHMQYGTPLALNAASWMYFVAINYLPPNLQTLASNALVDCHIGQAIDLSSSNVEFSEGFFEASSQERWQYYEKCVSFKTTRLILLSLDLLKKTLKLSKSEYQFTQNLIIRYGMVYQIFDDLKNIFPDLSGQKLNEDLKTGFRSAVSLEFLDLLNRKEKQEAFEILKKNNFFEHMIAHKKFNQAVKSCFEKAEKLLTETSEYIDQNLGNKNMTREYLSYLFEFPFFDVKKSIQQKIKFESK